MMKKSEKPQMLITNIRETRKKHTNQQFNTQKLVSLKINYPYQNNITMLLKTNYDEKFHPKIY